MRTGWFRALVLFAGLLSVACENFSGGRVVEAGLRDYEAAGAEVAAREWTEDYDCSNFSVQFYQNCRRVGLPCRVRIGRSGGDRFSAENHAWNSVRIDGTWVDWEPQLNGVYGGHVQTKTRRDEDLGDFLVEDIVRIVYETVGNYVPESVIDRYEIDTYWRENSPFYPYYVDHSYRLDNVSDRNTRSLVSRLREEIPANGSGGLYVTGDRQHLYFFFRHGDKYYGMENLEENDSPEGRSAAGRRGLPEVVASGAGFTRRDPDFTARAGTGEN